MHAFNLFKEKLCTSTFKDHIKSDMHQRALKLLNKSSASDIMVYRPIAKSFSTTNESAKGRI